MLGLGEQTTVIEVMQRCASTTSTCGPSASTCEPSWQPPAGAALRASDTFAWFAEEGEMDELQNVASGPLVRSSYHADQQAHGSKIG